MAADRIIRRTLAGTEWLISRETRIQSVLDKERDGLSTAEFNLYTRGSFDFVVYHEDENLPEFVIEFDGFGHEKETQISRDLIKNWLCVRADLPLLRIGSEELYAPEKLSVLEWLVGTFAQMASEVEDDAEGASKLESGLPLAEPKYGVLNVQTGEVFLDSKPPAWINPLELADADNYVLGANGGYFDSEHPFPANASIAYRLLRRFGITVGKEIEGLEAPWETAPYQLHVDWPGKQPPVIEDRSASEYVVSERALHVSARRVQTALYEDTGRARFASALKLHRRAGAGLGDAAPPTGRGLSEPGPGRFPLELPWLDPWGVARELALYDALTKVEHWAERNLRDLSLRAN
jgi:Protein of unknown function (DUF2726)